MRLREVHLMEDFIIEDLAITMNKMQNLWKALNREVI